jgi:hypothetical protein
MPSRKSRVGNWAYYDRSLVERGNLMGWLSPGAIARWNAKPSRRRGGQRKYSDLAVETALTLGPSHVVGGVLGPQHLQRLRFIPRTARSQKLSDRSVTAEALWKV